MGLSVKKSYVSCEKCGKRLIGRLPSGVFEFLFGGTDDQGFYAVDIRIHGSIKMRCLRKSCRHLNIVHFLPVVTEGSGTTDKQEAKED